MIATDEMVEITAKILVTMYGANHPNSTWPSQIANATTIVDAIVAIANAPQIAEQADLPPQQ